MVSVSTYVPVTNATPRRTASVVSASRSLRAKMPLIVALHMSFHLGRPRSHHRGALQRVATMRAHPGGANGAPRRPAGGRHRRRIGHRTGDVPAHDRGRCSRRGRRHQRRRRRAGRKGDRRARVRGRRHRLRRAECRRRRRRHQARRAQHGVQQRGREQPLAGARLAGRGMGSHRPPQPRRRLPRHQGDRTAPAGGRWRQHREHRVDQRDPPVGRRGALLGREGGRRRAHRERRARVRADHQGERGVAGDDPHRAHRRPAHHGRHGRAHGGEDTARPASARPRTSPTSSCSSAPISPVSSPGRTSSSTVG